MERWRAGNGTGFRLFLAENHRSGTAADYGYILTGVVKNATEIQAGEAEPDTLGVEAVDDKTFVVTLETECPYFLSLCTFAALMPLRQDVIEEYGNEWTNPGNMVSMALRSYGLGT